jgi:hypothetical protein
MGKITQDQIQFSDKRISAEQVNFAQEPTILFPGAEPESIRGRIGRGAQAAFEFGEDVRGVTGAVAEPAERLLMENLPIAGAILGSPLGIPGVAGGAALGELGRQTQFGTQAPESADALLTGMVKESGLALLGEAPALAVAGRTKKALQPFRGKMTPEAELAFETAQKKGLVLSPSSLIPSRRAGFFEWVSDKVPGGSFLRARQAQKLNDGIVLMYEEALQGLPTKQSRFDLGVELGETLRLARKNAVQLKDDAYANFAKSIVDTNMVSTSKIIDESVEALRVAGVDDRTREFLGKWALKKHTKWTVQDVVDFQANLWKNTYPDHKDIGDSITTALKNDVGEQAAGFLDLAKHRFQVMKDTIKELGRSKNPTASRIAQKMSQGDMEGVMITAIRGGNFKDLAVIRKHIPKELWNEVRTDFVKSLIDASTTKIGHELTFDVKKFSTLVGRYENQIKNLMPKVWPNLKGLANLGEFALKDLQRKAPTIGLGTASIIGTAIKTGASYGLVVPAGFSMLTSKSITNPSGLLQKWLTSGFKGDIAPHLVRTGLRSGVMKIGEELTRPPELKKPTPELKGL